MWNQEQWIEELNEKRRMEKERERQAAERGAYETAAGHRGAARAINELMEKERERNGKRV